MPTRSCVLATDIKRNAVVRFDVSSGAYIDDFLAAGTVNFLRHVAVGPDHNVYLTNWFDDLSAHPIVGGAVRRFRGTTGLFLSRFAASGTGEYEGDAGDLVFGSDNKLYLGTGRAAQLGGAASADAGSIRRYDGASGTFLDVFVAPGTSTLRDPQSLCFGPDGNLYVANADKEVLRFEGTTGAFIDIFVPEGSGGFEFLTPQGLCFGPDGNLYVSSSFHKSILCFEGNSGAFLNVFASSATSPLASPQGLGFGPDGKLYVCSGNSILRFDGQSGAYLDALVLPGNLPPNSAFSDLAFAEMPFPYPEFARNIRVPFWLTVIASFTLGVLVGRAVNEGIVSRRPGLLSR